jgi:hypothetical protein
MAEGSHEVMQPVKYHLQKASNVFATINREQAEKLLGSCDNRF